jgi:hypothetical protein
MNIVFDRVNIIENSLIEFCSCMERSESNELLIQYAVISIHNALQGIVTLTLKEADISSTWKDNQAKKWNEKELPKIIATEGLYKPDKDPQLDFFMRLYDKYFSQQSSSINRERINDLNNQRNNFIHFNTGILSIEKQYLVNSCNEGVKAILYIFENEKKLLEASQQKISDLLIKAQKYSK